MSLQCQVSWFDSVRFGFMSRQVALGNDVSCHWLERSGEVGLKALTRDQSSEVGDLMLELVGV